MTGFTKRIQELECEQKALETQMEKLRIQFQSSEQSGYVNLFQREARGLQSKITNVKMKMRSMKIKKKEKEFERNQTVRNPSNPSNCDVNNLSNRNNDVKASTEIDEIDDEFDPNDFNFVHQRPLSESLPDIPLSHSNFVWKRTGSVSKWRHVLDAGSLLSGNLGLKSSSVRGSFFFSERLL